MNKLVFVLAIQVGVVFALASSCSITHKSGDFACTKTSDCNTGRDCVDGFCVVLRHRADRFADWNRRGTARQRQRQQRLPGAVHELQRQPEDVRDRLPGRRRLQRPGRLPAGYSCDVKCDTDNSCRNGVECAGTTKLHGRVHGQELVPERAVRDEHV